MRDDIDKLNIPPSARRYARLRGPAAIVPGRKQGLYVKMVADLVNQGRTRGFANKDASQVVGGGHARRAVESEVEKTMLARERRPAVYVSRHENNLLARRQHGTPRFSTAVTWLKIVPGGDDKTLLRVLDAWEEHHDDLTGYVSWDRVAGALGLPVYDVAAAVKLVQRRWPDAVGLTVNRLGDLTYFKIKDPGRFRLGVADRA